jgi:hypothetical protein
MTPRAMKAFLAKVAIIDVVYAENAIRYRARIMGTEVERYYGKSTGAYIDEGAPEPFRERWSAVWGLSLEIEEPLRMTSKIEFRNQEYISMECLIAPLGELDQRPDTVLQVSNFSPTELSITVAKYV